MKETVEVTITIESEQVKEEVLAQLSTIGFDAFEETADQLIAFIDSSNFDENILKSVLSHYDLSFGKTTIEDQNWNALWESNFQPVVVDDFCAIRAEFHPPFTHKEHDILITPKMSFGTGHHATTYMMIKEMSKLDFQNKTVADFGTGTGVLAILAEKLGAKKVWACDIDDWSIENATENIMKNDCKNIEIEKTDGFTATEKFDIILANINKNVILSNVQLLASALKEAGEILLSGLLQHDEKEVVEAFSTRGFTHRSTVEKSNWICVSLQVV